MPCIDRICHGCLLACLRGEQGTATKAEKKKTEMNKMNTKKKQGENDERAYAKSKARN